MDAHVCDEEEQQRTHIEISDVQKIETKHTLITDEEEQPQTHIEIHEELKFETEPHTLGTDEEEQKSLGHLREEVQELRIESERTRRDIQTIMRILRQEEDTTSTFSSSNVHNDVRYLQQRLHILEEARIEIQDDIQQLKEHNNAANISISSLLPHRSPITMPSILMRNITTSDDRLPLDTFTFLMISRVRSRAWVLGILTFALQMALIIMIGISQIKDPVQSSLFDVPFKVDGVVRAGQLLTIVYTLATQNDIITSVRFIVMFWRDPRWDIALLRRHEGAPPPTNTLRVLHILLPNGLKFVQGLLVICITFVIIVQSDNIIDLLRNFTALMVMSEADNIFFWLAVNGYFGSELQKKTIEARDLDIRDEVTATYTNINRGPTNASIRSRTSDGNDGGFVTRSIILLAIGIAMVGGWLYIVINQLNGTYFHQRYPHCKPPEDQPEIDMFVLAKEHFGDEVCYGGPLNTHGCQFEGGDCDKFNLAFPLCKGNDLVNVQERVGDGTCNAEFDTAACDNDGKDCCPYKIFPLDGIFLNGLCNGGSANTKVCKYDNGECAEFNQKYPNCPIEKLSLIPGSDEVTLGDGICDSDIYNSQDCGYENGDCSCPLTVLSDPRLGNGQCNGGLFNTKECSYDNGDCNEFRISYPNCPLDDLSRVEGADDVVIGDGICDSDIYNSQDCGYENGDCSCPLNVLSDPRLGNGQCNGGLFNTKKCSYDNGDCNIFRISYPNCPLDDLSRVEGAADVVIGDGICDSGIYNLKECGYEFGDCNWGQVGQSISVTDDIEYYGQIYFHKFLSLDGMTMALGLYRTNEDGSFDYYNASGLVKIWKYNSIRKMWLQFGKDIVGPQEEDRFGYRMSLSANGNRLMISSRSGIRIYDFNVASDEWIQVGQTITSSIGVMTSDGSKVALVYSKDEIRIYDVDEASAYDVIKPVPNLAWSLIFNAKDGSRLVLCDGMFITRVYQFNPGKTPKSWTQIGQDIETATYYSPYSPSPISADGSRIALSTDAFSTSDPGRVDVYDYDAMNNIWVAVGNRIKSSSTGPSTLWNFNTNGDGFGYDIKMSSDGNLLVIASNGPHCRWGKNVFNIDKCTTGSIEVFNFHPDSNRFQKVIPNTASPFKANGNVLDLIDLVSNCAILFGFHFSMDGDGNMLSISGYNVDDEIAFVEAYNLNEFFYTKCFVEFADRIGDGRCDDIPPYNSEECGFDGGDCLE